MANSGYARGRLAPVALWALSLLLPALSLACYNPSITDMGLVCADAGKACPDGFECNAIDHKCHATITCSTPAVTPLCADAAKPGATCNPTCQVGCACGRCNVVGVGPICSTSVGTVKLGQICTPGTKDNCQAGFICLLESCGTSLGRCYEHCTTTAQCGTGRTCEVPILDGTGRDTGYRTCTLQTQLCNPVAAATANGCPSPSLTCFLNTDGTSFCDCPNDPPAILGAVCDTYNDCGAGLVCTPSAGSVGTHCRQACTQMSNSGCTNGQRCVAEGTMYGYCGGN